MNVNAPDKNSIWFCFTRKKKLILFLRKYKKRAAKIVKSINTRIDKGIGRGKK
jgi:hypothetical protein